MPRPLISLTTDFGLADGYVGAMKGVILGICPRASIVDISHDIRPQGVREAAYVLSTAAPFFPVGTVHLVVVDPGVGTGRRPIAVETERATYVAPDNGVLSLAFSQDSPQVAVHLTHTGYHLPQVSATFQGRDVFAPAAAHLAAGAVASDLGELIPPDDLVTLPVNRPVLQADGWWLGEVLHVDRFGNLVTTFRTGQSPGSGMIEVAGRRIPVLSRTYGDVKPGELLAYVGSGGYLEIAVRDGNAAAQLSVRVSDPVRATGSGVLHPVGAEERP